MPTASTAGAKGSKGATRPLLAVAAESIAAASGRPGTVVDVVHGKALRHYREGLRQYLAIRLGSAEMAERAFAGLRAVVAATEGDELAAPPGIRARLYGHARRIAERQLEGLAPGRRTRAALPWRRPRPGGELRSVELDRLRLELSPEDAELLELRHARELGPEEIAFVLERPVEDVLEALEAATGRARELLASGARAPRLRDALLEAFALDRGEPGTMIADGEGVEPLPRGTVIGSRYAIEARVGTGAFGDVYRAKDTEVPGHVVALKLLHQPALSDREKGSALRELHLIASVFHPSVVQFKDHGWHEQRLWFVMPWYEGETLESRIQRQPLGREEARRIFEPLARALATMHAAGIRHQDVKPENVFLARIRGFGKDDDEQEVLPVLIDLGVAAKEAEMVVAGTPTYFAPEVAAQFASVEHKPRVGPEADVFALALTLRNALEPETQQDVPAGATESFIESRARELPPMPQGRDLRFLRPVLERWMSLDAEERPSADELAEELAVLTRPEERKRRLAKVARWIVPVGVALIALFVATVHVLNARAEREKLEAERARIAEAEVRQDLEASRKERQDLEQSVEKARERYEQSRMSRKQLAGELAKTETRLGRVQSTLADTRDDKERLGTVLSQEREAHEQTREQLASAETSLDRARREGERLASEAEHLRSELEAARREADEASRRVASLDGRIEALEARLDAERAKSDRLEGEMQQAVEARAVAQERLARAQARIDRLEDERGSPEPQREQGDGPAEDGTSQGASSPPAPAATEPPRS